MPKKKNYVSKAVSASKPAQPQDNSAPDASTNPLGVERSADIRIEDIVGPERRNPNEIKQIHFSNWLGRGIDAWVWVAVDAITAELANGEREIETVGAYAAGMRMIFRFLTDKREQPVVPRPEDLRAIHVTQFIGWLKRRATARGHRDGQRTTYKNAKSALMCIHRRGALTGDSKSLFPVNPFSGASAGELEAKPLSDAEQQRVAAALKSDLVDLHHARLELTGAQTATVHYLVVAMRIGGNTTPLLEVGRDALRPGLIPGTMILDLRKRRAHKTILRAVRDSNSIPSENAAEVIPMDAVAVLRRMITISAPLSEQAPAKLKNVVWLYRSERKGVNHHGLIRRLTSNGVSTNISLLVERHGLTADTGEPLQLTTRRLRASMSHRAWRLSDGDPFAVADVLGNTARMVGTNYLSITEALKGEAATFIGDNLTVILRGKRPGSKVIPIQRDDPPGLTATPTARCGDTLNGERAPKDGTTHCRSFLLCLWCKAFVVVGEVDDLWRLFSFQHFLRVEEALINEVHGSDPSGSPEVDDLRSHLKRAVAFIDQFTASKFEPKLVSAAKTKVAGQLHPFWALETRKAERLWAPISGASAVTRKPK